MFVVPDYDDQETLAAAAPCSEKPIDFKTFNSIPNTGIIYINLNGFFELDHSYSLLSTLVHELFHIFAFNEKFMNIKKEDIN